MVATESDALLQHGNGREKKSMGGTWGSLVLLIGIIVVLVFLFFPTAIVDKKTLLSSATLIQQQKPLQSSKYTGTQFISFTINTMGGLAEHGECEGRHVDSNGVCYLGNSNITEDINHRLSIVKQVLDVLKEDKFSDDPEVDHRDDILKIFIMPEFFLRGPNGAYSTAQIFEEGLLIQVADEIRALIQVKDFSNYLFVFGTVIAARSYNDPRKPWEHASSGREVQYHNFAPIYKGGPNESQYFLATKRYISTVDFLNRTSLPNPRNDQIRVYSDVSDRLKALLQLRKVELVQDNVIQVDGLRIGIEICLDHRKGALWENLQNKYSAELVDVQLITSAGMSIERGPNPVVPGGVVYLSDGEASSAACLRTDDGVLDPSQVCRGHPDGRKHLQPYGGHNYSDFFTISACIDMEASDLLKGFYSLYQTQGCAYTLKLYGIDVMDEYKYYPPSIEIYPTVDLP